MRVENGEEMESISPSYISPERDQRTHDKDISNNFTNLKQYVLGPFSQARCNFMIFIIKPDQLYSELAF